MDPCHYLFVYGSLRSDSAPGRQPRLADWGNRLHEARLEGTLTQVDGYPMAIPGPGGDIRGEVWEILQPDMAWPALDAWEGPLYRRERVGVKLDVMGLTLECWAYVKA